MHMDGKISLLRIAFVDANKWHTKKKAIFDADSWNLPAENHLVFQVNMRPKSIELFKHEKRQLHVG